MVMRSGRRQQRRLDHRLVGQNPGVGGRRAVLQVDGARIDVLGDAHKAAGHDGPAIADLGEEQPQDERPRLQAAVAPDRHGRQRHRFLRDVVDGADRDVLEDPLATLGLERSTQHALTQAVRLALAGERRTR